MSGGVRGGVSRGGGRVWVCVCVGVGVDGGCLLLVMHTWTCTRMHNLRFSTGQTGFRYKYSHSDEQDKNRNHQTIVGKE